MFKRIVSVLLIAATLSVGLLEGLQLNAGAAVLAPPESFSALAGWADHLVKNRLSQFPALRQLAPALLLRAGVKEQDGIFITRDYLLENITPGDPAILESNLAGIERFLDSRNLPATLMLIPTAVAIKQQEVPAKAQLFNQKALISEVYDRFSGRATTIDVYPTLFAAKDQYTYYRTASALTGLGGYYVYTSLAARLGITPRALDQFEVEHLAHPYYGALYERSSYKGVGADIVTIYSFSKNDRQYKLTHTTPSGVKSYYTLFPRHLEQLSGPEAVILGGFSPRMDFSIASPYEDSFLIFADETVLAYLPFLLVHYGNVTVVDLERATPELLSSLDPSGYSQVMFAYSVDNFLHRPVSAAAALLA